ncbi:MAG: hypothetical protein R3191_06635 [Anaerolineales bacterium]|nr:hypothetical protein [Anaerolineales bacterium]
MKQLRSWGPWIAGGLIVAAVMAVLDAQGAPGVAFLAYAVISLVGVGLLWLAWNVVDGENAPRAVGIAVITAVLLRLVVSVGLFKALPVYGYDEKPQRAGYVYYDAYARDSDAWARARSDKPLLASFEQRTATDQYGGLLFVSASIHRYLSEGAHRPLTVALLTVAVSTTAVIFAWGAGAMRFGKGAAILAAWIVALYPDYVLLGASQMREAFLVPALGIGLYAYARARIGALRSAAALGTVAFGLAVLISPPFALLMTAVLVTAWFWEQRGLPRRILLGLIVLVVLAGAALALTSQAWSGVQGLDASNLPALLFGWLQEGAEFQLYELERGSGWVQKLFELTPGWAHLPLATLYGLSQPFLPAAIADNSGAPIWRAIAIFRAVGWFALLPFLLYAPLAALRASGLRSIQTYFALIVWLGALLGSYRAAGDLWDNPRYRAGFLVIQAVLAGWAWMHAKRAESPWLWRTAVLVLGGALVWLQWYLGRYYGTPRLNLNETLLLTAAAAAAWLLGSWWWDRRSPTARPA